MLTFIFLAVLAMFAVAGVFISMEARRSGRRLHVHAPAAQGGPATHGRANGVDD